MTRLTAMRVMTDHAEDLRDRLEYLRSAEAIKLAEARIDALLLAVEEMQGLEEMGR